MEVLNSIGLAAFRGKISEMGLQDATRSFEEDIASGRYVLADVLWRAALRRAADLSRDYTPQMGCRSLDVLHVACALELELANFLTFDVRQRRLARAVGLKIVTPRG